MAKFIEVSYGRFRRLLNVELLRNVVEEWGDRVTVDGLEVNESYDSLVQMIQAEATIASVSQPNMNV